MLVAVGLLAAGGGTFSEWYEEQQLTPGTVPAGELPMASVTAPVWTDQKGTIDPATYRMIPGDTVTFTTSTKITAVGDNLTASLAVDPTGLTVDDPTLLEGLDVSPAVTGLRGRPRSPRKTGRAEHVGPHRFHGRRGPFLVPGGSPCPSPGVTTGAPGIDSACRSG